MGRGRGTGGGVRGGGGGGVRVWEVCEGGVRAGWVDRV